MLLLFIFITMEFLMELLNKYIAGLLNSYGKKEKKKLPGKFVLHKQIIPQKSFPVFKQYKIVVWYVYNNKKVEWVTLTDIFKSKEEKEVELRSTVKLAMRIFEFLQTDFESKVEYFNEMTNYETT